MNNRSVVDMLKDHSITQPNRIAYTYMKDVDHIEDSLTYLQLDQKAKELAAYLQLHYSKGDRSLLLFPPGLEFIIAFMGCLYAGIIAVPAYPPRQNQHLKHLEPIIRDSEPSIILSTSSVLSRIENLTDKYPELSLDYLPCIATDSFSLPSAQDFIPTDIPLDALAFLQYTSGSTGNPKGVMVSHRNIINNLIMLQKNDLDENDVIVSWLPTFHDMGLIATILLPIYIGSKTYLISHISFAKDPLQWLKIISKYRGTFSGGPNFAYDLCIKNVTEEDKKALDLSSWRLAFNGAEPIHQQTLKQFSETFSSCGFNKEILEPSYGLAEATLIVASGKAKYLSIDANKLKKHIIEEIPPGAKQAISVVSSGTPAIGTEIKIVDPKTKEECPPERVGEIWVTSKSVTMGYWNKKLESQQTFHAKIHGNDDQEYLRTGDLGFINDNHLYVTGRLKDLIVIRGRNFYPQDIELTAAESHPALIPTCGSAFSIEDEGEEQLVVVHEVKRHTKDLDPVVRSIRRSVTYIHDIPVHHVVLIQRASIPKTTSGKIKRRQTKADYLNDKLKVVYKWNRSVEEAKPQTIDSNLTSNLHTKDIENWLIQKVAEKTDFPIAEIDPSKEFSYYGLDSTQSVQLATELEKWLQRTIPVTILWDSPTIKDLAKSLSDTKYLPVAEERQSRTGEPIAVVGISCRFPNANNPKEYWDLLSSKTDAITTVPKDRFDIEKFFDADPSIPGKTSSRWGGFIDEIDKFDPDFFGIQPREAASIDPQQRLLLELTKEALDDAGQPKNELIGSRTAVFLGISASEYAKLLYHNPNLIDIYSGTGGALSIAANRISYAFDLRGPSMAVDTACSSSLVSLHLACDSLQKGESDLAIAGGVNLIITPDLSINFSKMGAMAKDGRCKTFDSRADGYVRGEGAGLVILKPLSKALEDNDRIYSIIRGSAVNQDGFSNGITAPNRFAQEEVLKEAYKNARVLPGHVQYVETHGTGTPLGDPIEASALGHVLSEGRDPTHPVAIGSVKTNIGHLEAGAGIAGFIKVVLSLWNKQIPANLHYESPNPHIPFDSLPLYVPTELTPWPTIPGQKAIAGVSSFGFGGTNAHMVLEEAPTILDQGVTQATDDNPSKSYLLPISAKSIDSLHGSIKDYVHFLETLHHVDLQDISYTSTVRHDHYPNRIAFSGSSIDKLVQQMKDYMEFPIQPSMNKKDRKLAFVFSGHGSYWVNMGRELFHEPVFKNIIEYCDSILRNIHSEWTLLDQLTGKHEKIKDDADIQILVFTVQAALASLWKSWGIQPEVVIGHSMGEVTAAYIAGVLSLEDAVKLIYYRSRSLKKLNGNGKMAAVSLSEDEVQSYLADYEGRIYIAAVNSPRLTILSGITEDLKELLKSLREKKISGRFVQSNIAGHCSLVDVICPEFEQMIKDITFHTPRIPFYSTVIGKQVNVSLDAQYWIDNIRKPVLFSSAIQALINDEIDTFLEVSPAPILTSAIRHTLEAMKVEGNVITSLQRDKHDHQCMTNALGELYMLAFNPDWKSIYPQGNIVELPTYHWNKQRYWVTTDIYQSIEQMDKEIIDVSISIPEGDQKPVKIEPSNLEEGFTMIENQVRGLISKVLRLPIANIPPNKPLVSLGLDSLIAIELKNLLVNQLGVSIDISSLLESKSISKLANEIYQSMEVAGTREKDPVSLPSFEIDQENRYKPFPMNDMQHSYWIGRSGFIELGDVSGGIYLEFESESKEVEKLNKAWEQLIDRHEMLRTVFHPNGTQQILDYTPSYHIETEHLQDSGETEAISKIESITNEMSKQSLFGNQWPLFDIRVSYLPNNKMRTHIFFDGLISDATSLVILINEWKQFYDDLETVLEPIEISFRDYVLAEENRKNFDNYHVAKEYWLARLPELPAAPELPLRLSPNQLTNYTFKRRTKKMNQDQWNKLKAYAQDKEITPSMVLCTAYSEVLRTWSKTTNFTLNLTIHDRTPVHPQVTDILGVFTNLLLLEVSYDPTASFDLKARQLQRQIRQDMKHIAFNGVEVIREISRQNGNAIGQSIMPVVFTSILKDMGEDWNWLGELKRGIAETPQIWLDHVAYEVDGEVILIWDAVEDIFPEDMLEDMFESYFNLLLTLSESIESWGLLTPTLVPEKQIEQYVAMNKDKLDLQHDLLHAPFITNTRKNPNQPAIITSERTLTYDEVFRRSNQLAYLLKEKGAKPNQLVAVVMEKGWEQIIGTMGILFSGEAYLPIDPSLPTERVQYLLELGNVEIVVTQSSVHKKLSWPEKIECIIIQDDVFDNVPDTPHETRQNASDLAYVIFTSGTTGTPKGVMIDHTGALNTCLDINHKFKVQPTDRVLALSSLNFDLSVYDIFGIFAAGATVVLPNESGIRDPEHWATLVKDKKVTIWNSVPALMSIYLDYMEEISKYSKLTLRLVMLSGDWIPLQLPERIWDLNHEIDIFSLGGATEASIWSIYYKIEKVDPNWTAIPYGKPLANQQVFVLDDFLEHCPYWVPGHIYIGGTGVAKGYWKDEAKTVNSMIIHPKTKERLYRTGDLGVYKPDGNIHILGREDNQVKINGYRIELGEVESILSEYNDIKNSVVNVTGTFSNKHLIAYIIPERDVLDIELLKEYARSRLPSYMLPTNYVLLEDIPLTSNGKVDRKGLPEPVMHVSESNSFESPRNKTEEFIAHLWMNKLKLEKVGIHDNFFMLGGTSVQLIQLLAEIRQSGYSVEPQLLFEKQTIAELAQELNKHPSDEIGFDTPAPKENEVTILPTKEINWNTDSIRFQHVFLTGVTGYVGTYLLRDIITNTDATVYCLIRAKDTGDAKSRLLAQLTWYFPEVNISSWLERVVPIVGDITQQNLGLDEKEYINLCNLVDTVFHSAADVSHFGEYEHFHKVNVQGTEAIIAFSLTGRSKTLHFISTIGISGNKPNFTEFDLDVGQALPSPYSQTKLLAEKKVRNSVEQGGLKAVVYRLGFVGPDSKTGRFQRNIEDNALYLGLRAIIYTGLAPYLPDTTVEISPVDYITKAIVQTSQLPESLGQTYHLTDLSIRHYDFVRLIQAFGYAISVINEETYSNRLLEWCEDEEMLNDIAILILHENDNESDYYPATNEWTYNRLKEHGIEFPSITTTVLIKMIAYCIDIKFIKAPLNWEKIKNNYEDLLLLN